MLRAGLSVDMPRVGEPGDVRDEFHVRLRIVGVYLREKTGRRNFVPDRVLVAGAIRTNDDSMRKVRLIHGERNW